jgi:hypothetical protein
MSATHLVAAPSRLRALGLQLGRVTAERFEVRNPPVDLGRMRVVQADFLPTRRLATIPGTGQPVDRLAGVVTSRGMASAMAGRSEGGSWSARGEADGRRVSSGPRG